MNGAPSTADEIVSCIYSGTIRHRRADPASAFTHALSLLYLDLDELPRLLRGRLTSPRPGALRFRRSDFLGDPRVALKTAVADRVQQLTGRRPRGPIRLLAQLRCFGVCFNPVSFYYCADPSGVRTETVLAEVTNTPWGERHAYVLGDSAPGANVITGTFAKQLHVSPFMGMDHVYTARASDPGQTLSVHIDSARGGATTFDATLKLARRPLVDAELRRITHRHPAATARVLALIYGHALGLKLAGARYHPHPPAVTS